jgi:hypothetical protein
MQIVAAHIQRIGEKRAAIQAEGLVARETEDLIRPSSLCMKEGRPELRCRL